MKIQIEYYFSNELPFTLEIPDGSYEVYLSKEVSINIEVSSNMVAIYTAQYVEGIESKYYFVDKSEVEQFIKKSSISHYALKPLHTVVSYKKQVLRNEYTIEDFNRITDESCILNIINKNLNKNMSYYETKCLYEEAKETFYNMYDEEKTNIKKDILLSKESPPVKYIDYYYCAVNRLIDESAYLNENYWYYKMNPTTLEGTIIQTIYNNEVKRQEIFCGWTFNARLGKILPELTPTRTKNLRERLSAKCDIPVDKELLKVAYSLFYRYEFRAAIIEASAALETVVQNKISSVMKEKGFCKNKIIKELKQTQNEFDNRCTEALKKWTGKSFQNEKPELWKIIQCERKNIRHKIAHSDFNPMKEETEMFIKHIKDAIEYIDLL